MVAMNETSKEIFEQKSSGAYSVSVNGVDYEAGDMEVQGLVVCIAGQTNVDSLCGKQHYDY